MEMSLTLDWNDLRELRLARRELVRRIRVLRNDRACGKAPCSGQQRPGREAKATGAGDNAALRLRRQVRNLLKTRTGLLLVGPVARQLREGATVDEIAQLDEFSQFGRPFRKAHSLLAGLGRWERKRGVRVFENLGGRPKRFRIRPEILAVIDEVQREEAVAKA